MLREMRHVFLKNSQDMRLVVLLVGKQTVVGQLQTTIDNRHRDDLGSLSVPRLKGFDKIRTEFANVIPKIRINNRL